MPTRPSPRSERLGTPNTPAIRFTRDLVFEASLVRICYGLSGCSPPWTDRTKFPWSTGDFYIQASDGSVALPAAGYDYNSTGLLCWRDFHPQEWQLASLHRIGPSFPGPPGTFTSRLPAGRSPFPPLDMTTTATGLLCWRGFHPQEWQLASLHRIRSGSLPSFRGRAQRGARTP